MKIFKLSMVLLLICAIVAGVLGVVNYITADKIAQQQEEDGAQSQLVAQQPRTCGFQGEPGKHTADNRYRLYRRGRTEEHKGQHHGQQGVDMAVPLLFQLFRQTEGRFHRDKHTVEQTPEDKGQRHAMPQACGKEHDELIEDGAGLSFPVAAQGNIEVIPEPA